MQDYNFYTSIYQGDSIPADKFNRLALRASATLEQYKRELIVKGDENAHGMAICAMADAIYSFETIMAGMPSNTSIGNVSSSISTPQIDVSPKAQAAELYRCAKLYLSIYRGRG